jgi:hypothetical protein
LFPTKSEEERTKVEQKIHVTSILQKTAGGMKGAKVFQEICIIVATLLYRRIYGVIMHKP